MTKRVAIYARVSTTRQAENDISIPDQLARAQRYCRERGWHVVREFVDAGASARDDKRQEFQRMMDAACVDPSPFDVVLVHSQSRFFRDTVGYVFSKHRLQKHGVTLTSITQDFGEGAHADFAETIVAAADAFNSAETAKHVTRTMIENARQGFWNGARPPFGYRTVTIEQRGQRLKKRLEIDPGAAETVRTIFRLFQEGDGGHGPMGVKDIASWLNARSFTNANGHQFYTGEVHTILTREAYAGTQYFNRHDSRTRKQRPREEWVAIPVPAIIDPKAFAAVKQRLSDRRPTVTAPRITASLVLLSGIACCESCGSPLMLGTGKGGRYRYYVCASHRLKGKTACRKPIRVPERQLNELVLGALADHLLTPARLPILLREAQKHRRASTNGNAQRRSDLSRQLRENERKIRNLYEAVAEGTVADTLLLKDTLEKLESQRDQAIRLHDSLDVEAPPLRRALSKAQALMVAEKLRRGLLQAPAQLQRRYVRGLVSNILVDREKAVISGPKAAIAAAVTSQAVPGEVRTFVREWRTRQDSNL